MHGFQIRAIVSINFSNNTVLWKKAKAKNNYGEFTEIALGNGITKNNAFDEYGIPDIFTHESSTVTALDLDFNFDVERGNFKKIEITRFFDGEETFDFCCRFSRNLDGRRRFPRRYR